ncbi:MAG: Actin cross-linking toxin VgrG1 [Candidatus Erwinia impunctatus]|nr:Actin cross-linking toxin VgrG1 [Culicoides impunctatus]
MSEPVMLHFSHSHHLLTVRDCQRELDVLAFSGEEGLSQPFRYRIEFTSSDHTLSHEMMLMKAASLTLQAPVDQGYGIKVQQTERVIQGVVSGFERLNTSRDETHYALTLQPRLALLSRSHQNAIYQDMSVPQIVEKILRERHHLRGQDFLFSLSKEYPRREQVMQYGEDDLHFITRLLGEVGIWFRFTTDSRLNIDVVEFYDSVQGYETAVTLPSLALSGQHSAGRDAVWGMESCHQVVEKSVTTDDYNYRTATESLVGQSATAQSTAYGEAYHYAENYLSQGDSNEARPEVETGAFYARLRHERYLNGQTRLKGITSSATLKPGQVLHVTGGNEVTETFRQGVVVQGIVSHARRDRDFEVTFSALPVNAEVCYRPEPGERPVMAGTLPARVTSTRENDIYGHIDKAGRYRVTLLFDREQWETGFESLWVRQSRPYAGDTYGLHLPLLAGTEVAIGFEDGNPDRPYIAGVLHDSAHPDLVTIQNYKRNVLRTPSNNKIRLDDERGKEHIKIATEYGGKTQLNLGHLVDSERAQRGEGAELRTDDWVAVRGGKGVLLTSHAQPKAMSKQLSMDEIKRQLSNALSLAESLSSLLETADIDPLDNDIQHDFLQQNIDQLQQPVIVAAAPAGIVLSTPQHIQLSANQNHISTSGGNTEISALKRIALVAKKKMMLFVHELGMKLVAAAGDIVVQAQTGALEMTAVQGVTISSTDDEIVISARKKITLQCGGSFITLDPAQIEQGTNGHFKVKSAEFDYAAPATLNVPYPQFTACESMASEAASQGNATLPLS